MKEWYDMMEQEAAPAPREARGTRRTKENVYKHLYFSSFDGVAVNAITGEPLGCRTTSKEATRYYSVIAPNPQDKDDPRNPGALFWTGGPDEMTRYTQSLTGVGIVGSDLGIANWKLRKQENFLTH